MSLADDLVALGFAPMRDFDLQDDSDGHGVYIRRWLSAQPCPFPELIREPAAPPPVSE